MRTKEEMERDAGRILDIAEVATPGPWVWVARGDFFSLDGRNAVRVHSDGSACGEYSADIDLTGPDAMFIAQSRSIAPAIAQDNIDLRQELERVTAENAKLRASIEKARAEVQAHPAAPKYELRLKVAAILDEALS